MATLADITSAVAAETTVIGSVITLLSQLKTDLDEAIANAVNPEDVAAFQAVSDQIGANTSALAAAVAANTPVEAPVEPPVEPV